MKKVLKFLVAGGLAAITELLVYVLFNYAYGNKYIAIAQTFSYLCGFIVSFTLQRNWAFNSDGRVKSDLVKYIVLALANIILTNLVLYLLIEAVNLDVNISKLIVMTLVAMWNYFILSRLIFKSLKEKKKAEE